jgi:DNA helicase-2/ATP-dependent DNA helicase PcrA
MNDNDPFYKLVLDVALTVGSPEALLDAVIEGVSQPDIPPDVTEVRIMSLHKSKGLSSPVVIIAGCVEGLLPSAADSDLTPAENQAALEEQRRLFFVGITRVKADPTHDRPGVLVLTSSLSMSLADAIRSGIRPAGVEYGTAHVHASRFIRELGPTAPATQKA